ncbi:hypothetical protein MMC22_002591 [Lobaria immixta]|nr:hypothetical protein [Lobaria immixta]
MAKSKAAASKSAKDAQVKAISSVKEGAITKPSQTPKSKSKEIAKQVAVKADKSSKGDKSTKKSKKEPTPELSVSESENDTSATSASSASSDDESEPEVESKPAVASNEIKSNGAVKAAAQDVDESSESSDSSDDDQVKSVPKSAPADKKKNGTVTRSSDSEGDSDTGSDSEEDSEVSSEGSEDEKDEDLAVPGAVDSKALNGALTKVAASQQASSEEDAGSSDSSGSASDSEESSEDEAVASKKRKADTNVVPAAKKSKTEASGDDSGPKNLFVGQLSWNVDEDWLTREFERFGELSSVRVISDKNTGRSKGFGYVEFVNSDSAAKAQKELHGTSIDNRAINVDFSTPRPDAGGAGGYKERTKTYGDQRSPPSDTLFVANIAFEATENTIAEEFGKHGSVIGVRLPTSMDDGNPKGFGYVQFSSVEEASEALNNMSGATICGRPIRLDFSTPRSNNSGDGPRGGRGGRGRGGFDRGGRGGGRGRGGFDRGDRGGRGGGRGSSTNRGGFGDFKGRKVTF